MKDKVKLREIFEKVYMSHNPDSSVAYVEEIMGTPVNRYKYQFCQDNWEMFLDYVKELEK
ncbi:hypothetical protein [Salmonella phage SSBI34]|nr:hypothetical protein [Salmonella phage SSBI34]